MYLGYDYAGVLYPWVLVGAAALLVAALVMRRWDARGSKFAAVTRAIAGVAVAAAVIPGVWLLVSGTLRGTSALTVFIDLLIPIGLTLPSALPRIPAKAVHMASCALALGVFCLLGGFSIGPLYLPGAALGVLAGAVGLASPRTA